MKKMMKLNPKTSGEFSFEEIVSFYTNYLTKMTNKGLYFIERNKQYLSHLSKEDIYQNILIAMHKAYEKYDYDYTTDGHNNDECIGFFPYMNKTVEGELQRTIRDELKIRRKGYNLQELNMLSLDSTITSGNGSGYKEMTVSETIEDNKNYIEELFKKLEVEDLLSSLNDIDKGIIYDRFYNSMTQNELADKYGTTQVQISRKIYKTLKKMKVILESKEINNHNINIEKIEKEENKFMTDIKVTIDDLVAFLVSNSEKYTSLHQAITNFCYINECSANTMLKELAKDENYDDILEMYSSKTKQEKTIKAEEPKRAKANVSTKKEVEAKTIIDVPKSKVNVKIDIVDQDVFDDVKLLNVDIDLGYISASIGKSSIQLIENGQSHEGKYTIQELINFRNSLNKIIKVHTSLYK